MPNEPTPSPAGGKHTDLQQLEAALAAGHLTPELFATLRAQLSPTTPAAPKTTFSPSSDAELPSLLDMFNQAPATAAPAVGPPRAELLALLPVPSSPGPSAADIAARQRIETQLAQLRQQPPAIPAAPAFVPAPAPVFYPETPMPEFYPANPVAASLPPQQPTPAPPQTELAAGGPRRWPFVLLVLLAVVGALAYFITSSTHPDESLGSPPVVAGHSAPIEAAVPKPPKNTKKSLKKKRKTKHPVILTTTPTDINAPAYEPATTAAAEPAVVAEPPAVTRQPLPAISEAGDDAAMAKVRGVMAAYYADLFAPPMHASQHFAPQVERLYIQQNLTTATIDAELARSFFPDNQQAVAQMEPGTLRLSAPAADGSRTAAFTETMRLYRVSLRKNQLLRTQVRVRFNADYQIVYMRQEKLLANTFE